MTHNLAQGERIEITLPNGNRIVVEEMKEDVEEDNRNISVYHYFVEDGQTIGVDCLLDEDYTPPHTHRDAQGNHEPCPKSKEECDAWHQAEYERREEEEYYDGE